MITKALRYSNRTAGTRPNCDTSSAAIGANSAENSPATFTSEYTLVISPRSTSSTSRQSQEFWVTCQAPLTTDAARNHQKFCANAQIRHGIAHATTSKTAVVRRRPSLSVITPLSRPNTTWDSIEMRGQQPDLLVLDAECQHEHRCVRQHQHHREAPHRLGVDAGASVAAKVQHAGQQGASGAWHRISKPPPTDSRTQPASRPCAGVSAEGSRVRVSWATRSATSSGASRTVARQVLSCHTESTTRLRGCMTGNPQGATGSGPCRRGSHRHAATATPS